ncbi:AI-2E family transporter [Actinomycetospora chlora]|uniref:AI-2E family transporter n=1 Tax=Actinomycetospora chlora TaxID=663608 RepID=A0ABP9ABW0_9PSEU
MTALGVPDSPGDGAAGPLGDADAPDAGRGVVLPRRKRWEIPAGLEVATALSWRLLLLALAVAVIVYVLGLLGAVVLPVVLALIAASLLAPSAHALSRVRWLPHALATVIVIVGGVAIVGGVFYGVGLAFVSGLPELSSQLVASVAGIQEWLRTGPLGLNNEQFTAIGNQVLSTLQSSQATLAGSALGAVSTLGEAFTELLLALFTLIFFVYDGGTVWRFVLKAIPRQARNRADVAGRRAFASLVGYTRATILVAAADAITAGVGLWLIGVPLPVPLAALIFFGAFVPTLGAVVSGVVAVLVALVSGGITDALLVALLLLLVQNLEGYILQPLLLGRSIKLHPLAVVLPIACGLVLAGIAGALLAVPLVTVVDAGVRSLTRPSDGPPMDPETVDALDPRSARPDWHPEAQPPRHVVGRAVDALSRRRD